MRAFLQIVSLLALVGTILPPAAYAAGAISPDAMKLWMLVAAVAWFAATPFWMGERNSPSASPDAPRSGTAV